jgi:hypothetical protein
MSEAENRVVEMLEEFGAIQGVRGALVATAQGAYADGKHSGLDPVAASDVAKTVRRMVLASTTVGAPLDELQINFGAARMLVVPMRDDKTLVVMLERNTATAPVQSLLNLELERLNKLLALASGVSTGDSADPSEDEYAVLMSGELGPVLHKIQACFVGYVEKTGRSGAEADTMMRSQIAEWLLCCSPSTYTFPLLLDGLGQLFNEAPDQRAAFVADVHAILRESGALTDKTA